MFWQLTKKLLFLSMLFFPLLTWGKTYVLSEPIRKTTDVNLALKGITAVSEFGPAAMDTAVYYLATREPYSSSLMFGMQLLTQMPVYSAKLRAENELYGRYVRYRDIQDAISMEGIKEAKVLSTGFGEQAGLYNSKFHSSALIFADMEDGVEPKPIEGREWIPIDSYEDTKIRFRLEAPGIESPQSIEMTLKELFEGKKIDSEILKKWRKSISEWNKTRPFFRRTFTRKGLEDLKVTSSLVVGDVEQTLGEFMQGKGVRIVAGKDFIRNIMHWATLRKAGKTDWKAVSSTIISQGGCKTWYSRLIGREILKKNP
ncbi:MAG: hypothetical protein M9962_00250 [Oligoflexia bacterium]|nr:hypothetical protein [Oligoflexia bacterium]